MSDIDILLVPMSDRAGYSGKMERQVDDFQISVPYFVCVWAVVSRMVGFRNAFCCQLEPVALGLLLTEFTDSGAAAEIVQLLFEIPSVYCLLGMSMDSLWETDW